MNLPQESDSTDIRGCIDRGYKEYNSKATIDDGSCASLILTRSDIRLFLEDYYDMLDEKNTDKFSEMFAPIVDDYFNCISCKISNVISKASKSFRNYEEENYIDFGSLEYYSKDKKTIITYLLDYTSIKNGKVQPTKSKRIKSKMILNENNRIVYLKDSLVENLTQSRMSEIRNQIQDLRRKGNYDESNFQYQLEERDNIYYLTNEPYGAYTGEAFLDGFAMPDYSYYCQYFKGRKHGKEIIFRNTDTLPVQERFYDYNILIDIKCHGKESCSQVSKDMLDDFTKYY